MVYYINDLDINECARRIEKIFKGNPLPDAIFSGSDPKAIGAMQAFKNMGYSIPKDISIVSVDDLYLSEFMDPPLTTVRQPFYDMGVAAAETLIGMIEDEALKESEPIVKLLATTLMIRGSTEAKLKNPKSDIASECSRTRATQRD